MLFMRHLYLLLIAVASVQFAYGQNDWKTAEKYFGSFQYASAAKIYEKMLHANSGNRAATERLVVCYDKLNDPDKSEAILSALCGAEGAEPAYYKMYADVLAENAKYDQATEWYNKYLSITADENARKTVSGYTRLAEFYRDSVFYHVEKASFNSEGADFSPVYYKNGVVFCSSRGSGK
jgi:tetratricopeptide (TPR) repeat protein